MIGSRPNDDEKVALMAAKEVLDRAWGKPTQPLETNVSFAGEFETFIRSLNERQKAKTIELVAGENRANVRRISPLSSAPRPRPQMPAGIPEAADRPFYCPRQLAYSNTPLGPLRDGGEMTRKLGRTHEPLAAL